MTLPPQYHAGLTRFLQPYPELAWIHALGIKDNYPTAAESLHTLALQNNCSLMDRKVTILPLSLSLSLSLSRCVCVCVCCEAFLLINDWMQTFLSLGKLAALVGGDARVYEQDKELYLDRTNQLLYIARAQALYKLKAPGSTNATEPRPMSPEEIIFHFIGSKRVKKKPDSQQFILALEIFSKSDRVTDLNFRLI